MDTEGTLSAVEDTRPGPQLIEQGRISDKAPARCLFKQIRLPPISAEKYPLCLPLDLHCGITRVEEVNRVTREA